MDDLEMVKVDRGVTDSPESIDGPVERAASLIPRSDYGEFPSPETLKSTHARGSGGAGPGVLRFILAVVLAGLGILLGNCSFNNIKEMRQLERTPQVPIASIVTGEIHLRGELSALNEGQAVYSPYTRTPSLYYLYTKEEERTDSEGDTTWVTVERKSDVVDMRLRDETGGVAVRATDRGIEFDIGRSFRSQEGRYRHTEYRLHEGDQVFLFGFAERGPSGYEVGFVREGTYHPVISTGTEEGRRLSKALSSGYLVVGGVAALLFALLFVLKIFRVHHSIVFLIAAFLVMTTALSVQGYLMILSDLRGADDAVRRIQQEGQGVIQEKLAEHDIAWDGDLATLGAFDEPRYSSLSEHEVMRLNGVRALMAAMVERTNYNLSRFPENIIGMTMGLQRFEPIPLPPAEAARVKELESSHRPVRMSGLYGLIGLLIGLVGTYFGTRRGIREVALKRTIENVPTSPVAGAVYGLVELKGRVLPLNSDQILTGPVSDHPCISYRYLVERYEKSGKNHSWVTQIDRQEAAPFVCRDDSGAIVVDPEGAELLACHRKQKKSGNMRYTEWIIAPGEQVYVLGSTVLHPELHQELMVAQSDDETPYLISNYTERELMYQRAQNGFALLNFGIVATMMAGMATTGMIFSFGPALYLATAVFTCAYLLGILAVLYYNDLVFLQKRVERGLANIDIALKKRFDLVQNLNEVVQGYLGYEKGVQEAIALARQDAGRRGDKELPDIQAMMASARQRELVLARVEAHPQLKGHKIISQFMEALSRVEDEIAFVRQGYNDAVERYNTRLHHLPEMFIALLAGMQERQYFAAPLAREQDVEARLSPETRPPATNHR